MPAVLQTACAYARWYLDFPESMFVSAREDPKFSKMRSFPYQKQVLMQIGSLDWLRNLSNRATGNTRPCLTLSSGSRGDAPYGRSHSLRPQAELPGDANQTFLPFPRAEHVVDVLQAAQQSDRCRVIHIDVRAQ